MCRCSSDVFPHGVLFFGGGMGVPRPGSLTFSLILACVCCPSSTCRVNLYKTDICPISPIPELLGMVDKADEYALLGAESYLGRVVRIILPRYFRSPYKFVPISFLPLFSMELWVCQGLNYPRLHLRAITFFCLGLWAPHEQVGLAHKLLGPTIAPQNPAVQHPGWSGGFW